MSLRRIWILLRKELRQGASNVLFLYSLVFPIVLSLLIALVFGDLFAAIPRLGIYSAGESEWAAAMAANESLNTTLYSSEDALKAAVERGTVETGISIPDGFDAMLRNGEEVDLGIYRWGEANARNAFLIEAVIIRTFVDTAGYELPIRVNGIDLGDVDRTTWSQRLLPIMILMSVMLGGLLIPSSSLIEEKQKRTLSALTSTPTSLLDVYLSKVLLGFILSALMGVVILMMNNAFGNRPGLLVSVVSLGAVMASVIGIIIGSVVKDMDGLMATLKSFGIVLFAPGILEMFPNVPGWIAKFFPTYYLMEPLLKISQNGARFNDVAVDMAVLAAIVGVLMLVLVFIIERQKKQVVLVG